MEVGEKQMTVDEAVQKFVGQQILGVRFVRAESVLPLCELAVSLELALAEANERAAALEKEKKAQ